MESTVRLEGSLSPKAKEEEKEEEVEVEVDPNGSIPSASFKAPWTLDKLSDLLSRYMGVRVDDSSELPKYAYPSGGSLYPVQVYLITRSRTLSDLDGCYYFHRLHHQLHHLRDYAQLNSESKKLLERSEISFSIVLAADKSIVEMMYPGASQMFCYIEAGAMSSLVRGSIVNIIEADELSAAQKEELKHDLKLSEAHEVLRVLQF